MEVQRYVGMGHTFDHNWLEEAVLRIGDAFDIRIAWDSNTALFTGVCAVAGGLIGSYAGGRLGVAVGVGLGSATGLGVAAMIALRDLWNAIKDKLQELLYILYNYLRTLDPVDIVHSFDLLMICRASRRELVYTMLDFISVKLGREVISSITI